MTHHRHIKFPPFDIFFDKQSATAIIRTVAIACLVGVVFLGDYEFYGSSNSGAGLPLSIDGDLDAWVANSSFGENPSHVWLNDGAGVFTDSGQALGPEALSRTAVLGDLDQDGDLDAFIEASLKQGV